jgi:hypothetical protein
VLKKLLLRETRPSERGKNRSKIDDRNKLMCAPLKENANL